MASKRPLLRENIHRLFDEAASTDLGPGIVSLIESRATHAQIREVPVDRILPNPAQPRLSYEEDSLTELASSIREHGVLQPILVRPMGSQYELIAGERRWRASRLATRESIPAIVVDFDEETALEVSIIENLQREDVSPLEEAGMYRKMTDLGYSVRQLAQKIGKDKGYVENRLRLAEAPVEIRELVSVRKDTISHAYELMETGAHLVVRETFGSALETGVEALRRLGMPAYEAVTKTKPFANPQIQAAIAAGGLGIDSADKLDLSGPTVPDLAKFKAKIAG